MLGTATYMAPEQLENHAVGPSADVWSLGIVLLECLTGERVYASTPSEVLARRMAGPVTLPDGLPVPWKLLLTGMLAPIPDDRLSALDVSTMLAAPAFRNPWVRMSPASDLTTIAGDAGKARGGQDGETTITPPRVAPIATRGPSASATRTRNTRLIAALAAVVILGGVGLAFALGSNGPPVVTTTTIRSTTTVPPSTTTTLPSISHSLTKIVNDVVAGQSAHAIGPQSAQSISSGAQQAVTDLSSGNAAQAATDLQGVAATIANGVANAYMTPAYGTLLQADLTTLANALGLSAAATPSTSTTTSTALTGNPNGNGNGNGNGHGNGNGNGNGN
jgi:serine/threonine protein kinase